MTSAQLAQDQVNAEQAEANEALRQMALETISAAEKMVQSAARAARNARS